MFKQWLIQLGQYLKDQASLHSHDLSRTFCRKGPGRMPFRKRIMRKYLEGWDWSQRLRPARGAGSINVESDMQQLVRARLHRQAAKLYEDHHAIRGATDMRWGNVWYMDYKAGKYGNR
jgi:hypothetical protein